MVVTLIILLFLRKWYTFPEPLSSKLSSRIKKVSFLLQIASWLGWDKQLFATDTCWERENQFHTSAQAPYIGVVGKHKTDYGVFLFCFGIFCLISLFGFVVVVKLVGGTWVGWGEPGKCFRKGKNDKNIISNIFK